jgi:hypothetical protein
MSTIEFSDGIKFDTSGRYRVEYRKDGYYVVGQGMLCPVDNRAEGQQLVEELTANDEEQTRSS